MDKVPALANEDEETENLQYNLRFAKIVYILSNFW